MDQHKKVGQFIRSHYEEDTPGFLSESFSDDENYIRVSNYDRCFLSAQSQFYGLYSGGMTKNKSLSYPMYSEVRIEEALLRGFDVWYVFLVLSKPCCYVLFCIVKKVAIPGMPIVKVKNTTIKLLSFSLYLKNALMQLILKLTRTTWRKFLMQS